MSFSSTTLALVRAALRLHRPKMRAPAVKRFRDPAPLDFTTDTQEPKP